MEPFANVFYDNNPAEPGGLAASLKDAVEAGDLKALQLLARQPDFESSLAANNVRLIDTAAGYGHLDVVKWLLEKGTEPTECAINYAARYGHLDMLKLLLERGTIAADPSAITEAAANGHLHVLKWLLKKGDDAAPLPLGCMADTVSAAIVNGHLDVVKWLFKHMTKLVKFGKGRRGPQVFYGAISRAMDQAAGLGHLEMIKWLSDRSVCKGFGKKGHQRRRTPKLMTLGEFYGKTLHQGRCAHFKCSANAMNWAAQHGHLDMVKWLSANRSELGGFERGEAPFGCTSWALDEAAANGHVDVVRWLCENRTEGGTAEGIARAIACATDRGHSEMVALLLKRKAAAL